MAEPRIRALLSAYPQMAATVIAERIGWSWSTSWFRERVVGYRGQLGVLTRVAPFRRLSVRSVDGNRVGRFPLRAPFAYQLDALAAAVLLGEPVKPAPEDAIENMTVVDAIDRAASLPLTSWSER
jgi:predicted dehydrogenase